MPLPLCPYDSSRALLQCNHGFGQRFQCKDWQSMRRNADPSSGTRFTLTDPQTSLQCRFLQKMQQMSPLDATRSPRSMEKAKQAAAATLTCFWAMRQAFICIASKKSLVTTCNSILTMAETEYSRPTCCTSDRLCAFHTETISRQQRCLPLEVSNSGILAAGAGRGQEFCGRGRPAEWK